MSLNERPVGVHLSEGMVVTIEPGLYVEGIGGVRLESIFLIGANGAKAMNGAPTVTWNRQARD